MSSDSKHQAILSAFIEMIKTIPVERIRAEDIVDKAGVSRATFSGYSRTSMFNAGIVTTFFATVSPSHITLCRAVRFPSLIPRLCFLDVAAPCFFFLNAL